MKSDAFILYRNMEHAGVLERVAYLAEHSGDITSDKKEMRRLLYESINELIELAVNYGFEGNLWHNYLTFLMVNSENPYSISCEIRGDVGGGIDKIAFHDFEIFFELFHYDLHSIEANLQVDFLDMIQSYHSFDGHGTNFDQRVIERIANLTLQLHQAENSRAFQMLVTEFYKEYGVGKLGLHKAFRVEHRDGRTEILPITRIAQVQLEDLIGYEDAKQKLIDNTEAFVKGKRANNCLLFGDAGTGKSSSIKAVLNQYYDQGLRMIEVYKHQFQDLNEIISQIKNRNYKFIIYMDDLSFEEFETEYKYLKAVIEGGLEKKPENILIYATSNRRHLVRETFKDKAERDEDIHRNDTVQEKLSLAARFGVTIYYGKPDKKQFQQIVRVLSERNGLTIPQEELLLEANKWELSHGGMSGRCAEQFVDYLLGKV